jgi:hypothetical protein
VTGPWSAERQVPVRGAVAVVSTRSGCVCAKRGTLL